MAGLRHGTFDMGFFKDLTDEIDRMPVVRRAPDLSSDLASDLASDWGPSAGGDISEVLKYAPTKLRPRRSADDRLSRLEAETTYWRERASQAEVRVKFLEASVQRIASQFLKAG
jgi:hypothetical protein